MAKEMASAALLIAALLIVAGCLEPPTELNKPATPPDADIRTLLPPGSAHGALCPQAAEALAHVMPAGAVMTACRYQNSDRPLGVLKGLHRSWKSRDEFRNSTIVTSPSGGFAKYQGPERAGLIWTSGVWLFSAEAASEPLLMDLVSSSRAGGLGLSKTDSFVQRHFLWISLAAFVLGLVGTYSMMVGVARLVAVKPKPGVPALSRSQVKQRLLALGSQDRPFTVKPHEGCDLMVEWDIVDSSWWGILSKSGVKKVYRMRLTLDERRREVRYLEDMGTVQWTAGVVPAPSVGYRKSFFQGIVLFSHQRGAAWGFKDAALSSPGKVHDYKFDLRELKGPVTEAVAGAGWRLQPALFFWQLGKGREA